MHLMRSAAAGYMPFLSAKSLDTPAMFSSVRIHKPLCGAIEVKSFCNSTSLRMGGLLQYLKNFGSHSFLTSCGADSLILLVDRADRFAINIPCKWVVAV